MTYISISEFADRAGISRQSVYKRLKTDLQEFVNVVDGKKVISDAALKGFTCQSSDTESVNRATTGDKELSAALQGTLQAMQQTLTALQSELDAKNKQIEELTAMNNKLLDRIASDAKNLEHEHILQAQIMQRLPAPVPEETTEVAPDQSEDITPKANNAKKSILDFLFNKR